MSFSKENIYNSESALITAINAKSVSVALANGEQKSFDREHSVLKHVDYGYVLTNMKAQGADKLCGIGLMESRNRFSATLRNYYVEISRGINHITLVTDDKNNLVRTLEQNDDTKQSSIDFISTETLIAHQHRPSQNINIESVIDKKALKEQALSKKMAQIEEYRQATQHSAKRAKIAHEIIADKTLNRMAKSKLGFGYQVYRQDALRLETARLVKNLSTDERKKFNTVKQYCTANKAAQSAWKQAKEINPTASNKAYAINQSAIKNKLANTIAKNIEGYKPYLQHYSIGELNRLGLPQHFYQKEESAAQLRLERLTKQAEKHRLHVTYYKFVNKENDINQSYLAYHAQNTTNYLVQLASEKKLNITYAKTHNNIKTNAAVTRNVKHKEMELEI